MAFLFRPLSSLSYSNKSFKISQVVLLIILWLELCCCARSSVLSDDRYHNQMHYQKQKTKNHNYYHHHHHHNLDRQRSRRDHDEKLFQQESNFNSIDRFYDLSHALFDGMPLEEGAIPLETSLVKQDVGEGTR